MSRTNIDSAFSLYDGTITTTFWSRTDRNSPWRVPSVEVLKNRQTVYGNVTRISNVTSSYKFASKFGNLPENQFSFVKVTIGKFLGSLSYQTAYTRWQQDGYFGGPDAVPRFFSGVQLANLENQVKQKLSAKIKDQDINLGQAFAERDQTLKLIGDALRQLAKALAALKRGNLAAAAKALGITPPPGGGGFNPAWRKNQSKAIARGWLQLQYGWRPLLSDIYGACEALRKFHIKNEYKVVSYSATAKMRSTSHENFGTTRDIHTFASTCTMTCRVKMRRSTPQLATLNSLGLTNPAVLGWELLPFSFVFDWAVPIGSFLGQFDSHIGWSFVTGSITSFRTENVEVQRVTLSVPSGYDFYSNTGTKYTHWITCTRIPIAGFQSLWSIPYVKDPSSLEHAANALALFLSHKR